MTEPRKSTGRSMAKSIQLFGTALMLSVWYVGHQYLSELLSPMPMDTQFYEIVIPAEASAALFMTIMMLSPFLLSEEGFEPITELWLDDPDQ